MSVLINFKICDNAKECLGVEVCPTNALYWDEKNQTIKFDEAKCSLCGRCERACGINAIKVARNDKEYARYKKEIDDDPRKVTDLFIDRYGATPVHPAFQLNPEKFEKEIIESEKITALEVYNNESIECLLNSIPIKELLENTIDIKYRKMAAGDDFIKRYQINDLPSLLFFKRGKMLNKIEGFFGAGEKEDFKSRVKDLLENI